VVRVGEPVHFEASRRLATVHPSSQGPLVTLLDEALTKLVEGTDPADPDTSLTQATSAGMMGWTMRLIEAWQLSSDADEADDSTGTGVSSQEMYHSSMARLKGGCVALLSLLWGNSAEVAGQSTFQLLFLVHRVALGIVFYNSERMLKGAAGHHCMGS
jgi:hypothetical protein